MDQNEKKEFTFINEQIKKKPFYRRKWFIQGVTGILIALVFGSIAGIAFAIVRPWAELQFGEPDEPTQIVVVQEETQAQTEDRAMPDEKAEPPTSVELKESEAAAEMDISSYKKLYEQMNDVADEALASIVKVKGYTTQMDWFNEEYENMTEASGLILSVDSRKLYILTSSRVTDNAQQIAVTFQNNESVEAAVRKQDAVTEMAVLEVPMTSLSDTIRTSIDSLSMKGVSGAKKGEPVIAVGSPLGYTDSLAFGMITSVTNVQSMDADYGVISTDINGNENSYGILLNLDGEIVGIISQKFEQNTVHNTVSALRISDMSYLMDALMMNRPIPYIGITGKEVGTEEAVRFDMAEGIYVQQVAADSPAMYAGIQVADVITGINGQEIKKIYDYEEFIKQHKEGDILTVEVSRKGPEGYAFVQIEVTVGAR